MSRSASQDAIRIDEGKAVTQAFQQIRQGTLSIQATMTNMATMLAKWQAGLTAGDYDQADVDYLTGLLAPWATPLPAGTTFAAAVQSFIASGIGA